MMSNKRPAARGLVGGLLLLLLAGMASADARAEEITMASTTSTEQSGLFSQLLPDFKKATQVDVKVVAVGTGQAIDMARRGDADVLFVHDRVAEEKFVADGFAERRYPVMYNDFVLVGPKADPAKTRGNDIVEALNGLHLDSTRAEMVNKALAGKTKEEVEYSKAMYKAETGRDMDMDMQSRLSGAALIEAKAHARQDKTAAAVAKGLLPTAPVRSSSPAYTSGSTAMRPRDRRAGPPGTPGRSTHRRCPAGERRNSRKRLAVGRLGAPLRIPAGSGVTTVSPGGSRKPMRSGPISAMRDHAY